MLYLTGQKRGMSELNLVWPVILTGIHAAVISSPGTVVLLKTRLCSLAWHSFQLCLYVL